MKLLRHGAPGEERPGIVDASEVTRDLGAHVADIDGALFSSDQLKHLAELDLSSLPEVPDSERIGPCVANVGKIVCIGLNFTDHAEETGSPIPEEPIVFMKSPTAISGPFDPVQQPVGSTKLDWEVELAVLIGREARHVSRAGAADHIAGYCVMNDVSERAFQIERGGQWTKGKSCDTFAPLGPWLVTPDEIPNVQDLGMWLDVDGDRKQDSSTSSMIFPVDELISYVSHFMTLIPGDVISTGTPAGVAIGAKPPAYLQPGQTIELGVERLGRQRQTIVPAEPT